MLAHTIRKNLTNSKNSAIRTKATKYSDLFLSEVTSENTYDVRQVLNEDKSVQIDVDDNVLLTDVESDATPEEIAEYIVEDPNEIIVDFQIKVGENSGLPFFKSINEKLFGTQKIISI